MVAVLLPAMMQAQQADAPPHTVERAMSIQTLQTAGNGSKTRQVVGLVGSLTLAAIVTAGVVIGRSHQQAGSTEMAVVTSEQAAQSSSALPADSLGGVAERTQLQGYVVAPRTDAMGGMAEQAAIQRSLDSEAQAKVMGGVAERMTMQSQLTTTAPTSATGAVSMYIQYVEGQGGTP
jgi:hypothetical protein